MYTLGEPLCNSFPGLLVFFSTYDGAESATYYLSFGINSAPDILDLRYTDRPFVCFLRTDGEYMHGSLCVCPFQTGYLGSW
jgi:hypothetical protein